jgi:hypothetical protein
MGISIVPTTFEFLQGWDKDCPNFRFSEIDRNWDYIIQKGQGLMIDGGKEFQISAGDAVLTGQGASHSIKNTGAEDLVATAVIIKY